MIVLICIALLALFLTNRSCLNPSPSVTIPLQLQVFICRLSTPLLEMLAMGRKRLPLDPLTLHVAGTPVLSADRRRSAGDGHRAACLHDGQAKRQCAK
jgi:hypothetical protein